MKEGDIIRFGRIITRVKEIVLNKNLKKNINDFNFNKDNIIFRNAHNNELFTKSGEITNRKGVVSKINSLKLSNDMKKINYLKINGDKKEEKKEEENTKNKEKITLKETQTIPVDFLENQISNKKSKLPKLCKICYGEEEDPDNPLVQPCQCSGSLKYIHLKCLKHWLNTKSCINVDSNERYSVFLVKKIECEICKQKFPDFVKHKDKLYEILEPNIDFNCYCILENLSLDKDGKRFIYVINLERNEKLKIGRGHDAHLTLSDISVSRIHGILIIENKKF